MTLLVALLIALQFQGRPPLAPFDVAQGSPERSRGAPAETLIEPGVLRTIEMGSVEGKAVTVVTGTDVAAGEIVIACRPSQCEAAEWAMKRIANSAVEKPSRTIRLVQGGEPPANTKAAIFIAQSQGSVVQVIRGLWSTAGIGDEVVEVFTGHAVRAAGLRAYANVGQPRWESRGIAVTTLVPPADASGLDRISFIAAASAYFLATLPNAGAEALLSHLTVGAHTRLAEDGRRAVAQMGNQQRAGADVLIMFGQAIEREQRRMRSFERFMPEPVDPMLRSRLADMEKGISGVWTSMGITSSPFVPAAERIRGRGGDDRRVPARATAVWPAVDVPGQFGKFDNADDIIFELANFIDGKRTISDIRDAVSAEFGSVPLPPVVEYFERLAKTGAVTLR